MEAGTREFTSPEAAEGSPLASALFDLGDVTGVFFGADFVSVTAAPGVDWTPLKPQVVSILLDHFVSEAPLFSGGDAGAIALPAEDTIADDPADAGTGTTHIKWRGPTFTAVLNPEDGRKNWPDLVSAFVFALRDRSDATLLIKVVHRDAERGVAPIAAALRRLGDFACRVVLVQAFLPDADYRHLVAGSTFAVNASRGEGQCLPLMEFMSAGVPAIAPDHTAMADYVSPDNAFVVPSGREPSAWPQDPRLLFTCHRRAIDWGALVAAYRSAYRVATTDPAQYSAMSAAAIAATRSYCSIETVLAGLDGFLQALSLKWADD